MMGSSLKVSRPGAEICLALQLGNAIMKVRVGGHDQRISQEGHSYALSRATQGTNLQF